MKIKLFLTMIMGLCATAVCAQPLPCLFLQRYSGLFVIPNIPAFFKILPGLFRIASNTHVGPASLQALHTSLLTNKLIYNV